ncbi:MAG: TraR/DksA C4-type zinc finger protein [Opitutaceae bacterium]|nr:TraR/DksA C4-type zinc finger protein [Opitutaceae bacterium]
MVATLSHPTARTSASRLHGRIHSSPIDSRWAWHYRTLLGLRLRLRHGQGSRLRELAQPLEHPTLHAVDLVDLDLERCLPADPAEARWLIDRALDRIERGTYGICPVTGRAIPEARLRAAPWRETAGR